MDKFDQRIKHAMRTIEPTSNFVEVTMQQVENVQVKKRWNLKLWIPVTAGSVAVIAIVLVTIALVGHNDASKKNSNQSVATNQVQQTQPSQSSTVNPPSGTDNASLASDLSGIDGAMSNENADQSSATAAINDNSQQIAVPTN